MPHIHVLIRDAPKILREILEQAIAVERDMDVIAEPARPATEPDALVAPDVVVVDASDREADERGRALLREWPHSRVITIRTRGHVSIYELVPQGRDLGELSPSQLVDAIRTAVRADRTRWTH